MYRTHANLFYFNTQVSTEMLANKQRCTINQSFSETDILYFNFIRMSAAISLDLIWSIRYKGKPFKRKFT